MISSVSPQDDDLLCSAYANISLIADKAWAFNPEDSYRKLNQSLWVQICKLSAKYSENGNSQIKRVRDIIPGSRLAQYGNYEYDEEREKKYKPVENFRLEHCVACQRIGVPEPWMLQEVEEHFTQLSAPIYAPTHDEHFASRTPHYGRVKNNGTNIRVQEKEEELLMRRNIMTPVNIVENHEGRNSSERPYNSIRESNNASSNNDYDKFVPLRYTIDNIEEMELQSRITSDMVRNLWSQVSLQETFLYPSYQVQPHLLLQRPEPVLLQSSQKLPKLQNQEFHFYNWQNHQTFIKVGHYFPTAQAVGIMRGPPLPILSPEVPEFFPKRCGTPFNEYDERGVPLQFFPSSSETCYHEEMFPYNRRQAATLGPAFQSASIPIMPLPGVNTIIQHPHQWFHRVGLPLQLQVPVCTPPQPICASIQPICPTVIQRPIQLPEKTIPPSHITAAPIPVYQRPPELYQEYPQRRKNQGVDFNNLILLTKSAIKTRKTQSKAPQQNSSFTNLKSNSDIFWVDKGKVEQDSSDFCSEFQNSENKCYCLKMKSSEQDNSCKLEKSVFVNESEIDISQKKRLYRDVLTNSSSTEVLENAFEKTYDDLERQAMEQYRASEECLALRYQELERQALEQYRNGENSGSGNFLKIDFVESEYSKRGDDQSSLSGKDCAGVECPGYESCSSVEGASSAKEIGILHQSKITISKPEGKFVSSNLHRYGSHTSIRSGVIAKSLTTLSRNISQDWKLKGASGDKNDETGSLKRQLLLLSALKQKASASFLKTSVLKSSCTNSIPILCQMPAMMQTGGGDEKIAFECSLNALQNPLFLSSEQLTNGSSDSVSLNHVVSSQQAEEPFSELDFERKSQDELNLLSSEVRLISVASGLEDEYHLTERYFSLKIGQHLKQLSKKSSSDEKKVEDSLECCLKKLLCICLSCNSSISESFDDSYIDNFKLEMSTLKNWVDMKEEKTNFSIEATNFLEKNCLYKTMTTEYFENLPDFLKRACVILMKIKNDKYHLELEMPWLQFLQWEEYHNKENIVDEFLGCSVLEIIQSNCNDKID